MSTSFYFLAVPESMDHNDGLTAHMSTGAANELLDIILPGWDKQHGTVGIILRHQLRGCLSRIKPLLDKAPSRETKHLAAVLFAAEMMGGDVIFG